MPTYNGVAISFGAGTVSATPIVGKLQTLDVTNNGDVDAVRDENGQTVTRTHYDPNSDATFEYVVTGAALTAADAGSTLAAVGTLVTLTASGGAALINGQIFSVESGIKLARSNVGAARVTIPLKRFPAITAVAS